MAFVRSFREAKERCERKTQAQPCLWTPPTASLLKMNVDAGRIGEDNWGWGFVIRSHDGDVLLVGNMQGSGFIDAETEEARAFLFGLQQAKETGHTELIIKCDCMNLVQKLNAKEVHENFVRWVIQDILRLVESFNHYPWSFVKRGGNKVAHEPAHLQPISFVERVLCHGHRKICTPILIQR